MFLFWRPYKQFAASLQKQTRFFSSSFSFFWGNDFPSRLSICVFIRSSKGNICIGKNSSFPYYLRGLPLRIATSGTDELDVSVLYCRGALAPLTI